VHFVAFFRAVTFLTDVVENWFIWWSWCRKTVLIMELINNIAKEHGGVSVLLVLVKEHEGNDLYAEMKESKVIDANNFENSKVALVYGQMNEPPGARMRVALTALTMAEYFRDTNDVLLFVDIFSVLYKQVLKYLLIRKNAICSRLPTYTFNRS
jgi:hypothetical protein